MEKSGRSVLWFLAGCLFLVEALLGIASQMSLNIQGWLLLLFAFLSLIATLATLIVLFFKDPMLLLAQTEHVIPVRVVDRLTDLKDPELLRIALAQLLQDPSREESSGIDEFPTESGNFIEDVEEDAEEETEEDVLDVKEFMNSFDEFIRRNEEKSQ